MIHVPHDFHPPIPTLTAHFNTIESSYVCQYVLYQVMSVGKLSQQQFPVPRREFRTFC